MNIVGLFPVPVGITKLDRDFTAEELDFLLNQETHKNAGNMTSNDRQILDHEKLSGLKNYVQSFVDEFFTKIYAPKNEVRLRLTQSWTNVTKKGEYHHKHAHASSFLSGCLYVKALENSDKITFYKEGYKMISFSSDNYHTYNSTSWWVPVKTGDLIVFPSDLTHMVETVKDNDMRVSIAFNTFPVGYIGDDETLTGLHI